MLQSKLVAMIRISPTFLNTTLVAIFVSVVAAFSQEAPTSNGQYSAPVNWTEYHISSQNLSIPFPKVPVIREASDPCSQTEGALYHAYAGGVVYEFEWHAKSRNAIPNWCSTKTKFSKTAFTKRLDELKAQNWGYVESDGTVAEISAKVLRSTSTIGSIVKTRWLIWQKDRWLELGITRRKETVVDEARFSRGLKLLSSKGLDLGSGADATFGDADVDLKSNFEGKSREAIAIVTKPKPAYTEEARQSNIQGTVILRVTFLRNGGIGSVSVVKGLTLGLTEQSIIAARKVAFLPGTVDGQPINMTKMIEYTFGIY